MDGLFKVVVYMGLGAGILYGIQELQKEKNLPNPEDDIEEELLERIRQKELEERYSLPVARY